LGKLFAIVVICKKVMFGRRVQIENTVDIGSADSGDWVPSQAILSVLFGGQPLTRAVELAVLGTAAVETPSFDGERA
jgi:hypothetical protein